MSEPKVITEQYRVKGEELLGKVRQLLHEGNIRHIKIRNEQGQTLIEIPLTLGVFGAVLLPVWAAIGAIATLAANCSVIVEKVEPSSEEQAPQNAEGITTEAATGHGMAEEPAGPAISGDTSSWPEKQIEGAQ